MPPSDAALSVLFVAALAFVFLGLSWPVIAVCGRHSRLTLCERVALALGLGPLAVYAGVFAIGSVRLNAVSMWSLAVVLIVCAVPGLRSFPYRQLAENISEDLRAGGLRTQILAAGVGLLALSTLLQGLAPPSDFDSLMYHLTLPAYDVEAGRLSVPWDRALPAVFFPALGGHLSRFALATMNGGAAQMIHGSLGLIAGLAAALIVRRLGYGRDVSLAAALLFLATRVVVWEMATVEVDLLLASYCALALLVYLAWRDQPHALGAALFGILLGMGFLTKYHGLLVTLAFAPVMLVDAVRRRIAWRDVMLTAPATMLLLVLPHMVRTFAYTHNPVFPLLNKLFNPGADDPYLGLAEAFGTGRGILDLATTPWTMQILPMRYFDGMIFGAPYFLALIPLLLLAPRRTRNWIIPLTIAGTYYVLWFYLVGQQVRFLLPIMPILAAAAAAGFAEGWNSVSQQRGLRSAFAGIAVVFAITQIMFIGAYAGLRLPVAVGLRDSYAYLADTPTMEGAFIDSCSFIRRQLRPGERYFALTQPMSYYCPQTAAVQGYFADEDKWWLTSVTPPAMSLADFVRHLEAEDFRFVLLPTRYENRRNETAQVEEGAYPLSQQRLGRYLAPVLDETKPVFAGKETAVYDGRDILRVLKRELAGG